MKYLDFLTLLLSFGPKLPQAIAIIQRIVADFQELAALFNVKTPTAAPRMALTGLSAKEKAAEAKVLAKLRPKPGMRSVAAATFSGGWLQAIWAFFQAHPELITILLSLLGKK